MCAFPDGSMASESLNMDYLTFSCLYVACLFILVALFFYIFGRLHAWYKKSLIMAVNDNSVIGTEYLKNTAAFHPRAIYVPWIRNYLKPGQIIQKRGSETVLTEPACHGGKKHSNAVAEATIKIEAIRNAVEDRKLP